MGEILSTVLILFVLAGVSIRLRDMQRELVRVGQLTALMAATIRTRRTDDIPAVTDAKSDSEVQPH